MSLDKSLEVSNKDIKFLEKTASIIIGPVIGFAPERWQLKFTKGNYKKAYIMANTSRIVNGLWAVYSTVSVIAKAFGADIDSTPGNIATLAGIPLIIDTIAREAHFVWETMLRYNKETPVIVGEPLWTYLDNKKHPEWYKTH